MPPAFVLSQDQTLHKIYFRVLSSFTYLLALFPFPKKLFELSESALSVSLIVFSLSSGLFAFQLFNFQRAFRRLATAFIYYHIICSLSTPFYYFFKYFLVFVRSADVIVILSLISPFVNMISSKFNLCKETKKVPVFYSETFSTYYILLIISHFIQLVHRSNQGT